MSDEEYTCSVCNETYKKCNDEEWNDEKAKQELKDNFGEDEEPEDDCGIVCDDCYNKMVPKNKEIVWKAELITVGEKDRWGNIYTEKCLKDVAFGREDLYYDEQKKCLVGINKIMLSELKKRIVDVKAGLNYIRSDECKADPFKGLEGLFSEKTD